MADRLGSVNNAEINWIIAPDIQALGPAYYDQIAVLRSSSENSGYTTVAQIASKDALGNFVTSYVDPNVAASGKDASYYLVQFVNTSVAPNINSKFFPTFFSLTPRELRLVNALRGYLSQYLVQTMSDEDLRQGIQLAIQAFNIQPPLTDFTIDTFPPQYEALLLTGAQIYTLLFKYLNVAITDFSYGDMGLSLNIDRGAKVKQAVDNLLNVYNKLVEVAKLEFAWTGSGLGTLQLPISLGGNLNRGILNVLDIFTSLGR